MYQEFTLPETLKQNTHLKSYNSILENAIYQIIELDNLENSKEILNRFKEFYNFK